MSFTSELDICGGVASQGIIVKPVFMENELQQCTLKGEDIGETQVVNEEAVVNTNGYSLDEVVDQTKSTMYFVQSLEGCDMVKFEESMDTVPLTEDSSIIEKWVCENVEEPVTKEHEESEEQEDDEETIATFVTAAGQQLALYSVEDSDEVFAVAVYNGESDEPPNNFQFLMKADVERLIGEGAVRTVKKPSQMKRRVFTAEPPTFYRKEESEEINDKISDCDTSVDCKKDVVQDENSIEHNYETYRNFSDFTKINSKFSDSVGTDVNNSDITYLMMDDNFVNAAEQPDESQNNLKLEDEFVEHSTVQYILLEADYQSDSELTFDEILTTLQNMKISRKKSFEMNDKRSNELQDDCSSIQQNLHESSIKVKRSSFSEDTDQCESPPSTIDRTSSLEADRQRLIDALTDSPSTATTNLPQTPLKVKRSRKQQLISVDRDDGEIIIQPASMMNEEITGKKRTVRRRQLSSQIRVAMANSKGIRQTKQDKKLKRRKVVEVIDLDVDEEEQQTRGANIVEITLDDNKDDKYSSDKENEIIMVRDSDSDDSSDDEEEEERDNEWQPGGSLTKFNNVIRCKYCSKNFRYRRTLKMHLLVCQKSPEKVLNLDKRKSVKDKENQSAKKEFTCKICQEKFDMVVALARHVRSAHSQRKKQKLSFSSAKTSSKSLRSVQRGMTSTEEEEESDEDETTKTDLSMLARVKRKRKQINYSLDTKKLNCADCGRWFPSTALLNAHSLQHGTKKSEQLRKCRICKKLIKSRLLFLRHLRMHNDTRHNSSSSSSTMLRRKLRARPSKVASPRKRGRPRKL
ncbi:uncharacterized protein LOC105838973 [Monomorium pharaonis]|uniref:uncharacterized protein LOC105838973 n=1 Tax=Monomorium pharaonis TaxID=307658 RepID=UPI00063F857D|nr:uncharacterized protein LOC105838973 [Monomorium pharaonis]XP_012540396.1 uncharacterized protein LOC105838973 [Monomorium pharaonis]XP_036143524.1 uncharacterized protein LOC105838973 [Monomorium pharaonis]